MKVRDLIAALAAVDQDMPVMVDAYESGFELPKNATVVSVAVDHDRDEEDWWVGTFCAASPGHPKGADAFIISRKHKPWD